MKMIVRSIVEDIQTMLRKIAEHFTRTFIGFVILLNYFFFIFPGDDMTGNAI